MMKILVKYEFLKILRKKSTLIVMAVSLIVTAFLFGLPIIQFQTYHQDGVMKGLKGISYKKAQYTDVSVPLTEEYVTDTIREVQQLFDNPDHIGYDGTEEFLIGDAYWNEIAPRESLLNMIARNYVNPGEYAGYNSMPEIDVTNGANFYETRNSKIETLLNDPSRGLSAEQKAYWRQMNSKVKTPLQYGYYEGWEIILTSFELFMFALLAVCIAIAPVFCGEYQAGTDAVILSGKYGKTRLIAAKITASLLFGLTSFTLHVVLAFGLLLAAFGTDGWNLPLQIAGTTVPYPLTFMQAALINLGVIYLVLLAMMGLTLFLSAKMKNSYLVLAVIVPVLFLPMFLTPSGTTGIYNLILFLLPYRSTIPETGNYVSYQFGGLVLDLLSVRAILYAALTVLLLPFARLGFKKHQVS
ncbi:MAG: ABC transporter permease subunit [Eubacteriales bacterium]|nr:ABC transporter permease subunit [Eubacteriales bacterium]